MTTSAIDTMVGLVPLAMTGGIVLGLTQESMRIPGRLQAEREEYRPRMRRRRNSAHAEYHADPIWERLFGLPPSQY